ncbi:MAG: pantoate--beta-alanine ligase [Chloroflexota bacterium]|nr:pantoate--beta-alanine ligase [Chloroflexota bacterium]
MNVITTIAPARAAIGQSARPLGLVPTMGYLHAGHLSLVRAARAENATVVVSIFVNPTQFGPAEDFDSYPRDVQSDRQLLEAEQVDLLFAPQPEEMYPQGSDTFIRPGKVAEPLEGAHRPGHFTGVATVVAKLFNILQPDRAYFGQKDAQQLAVIRKMVADLNFPLDVRALPIVREADGLALSSRNVYLSAPERAAALALSRALGQAQQLYQAGERDAGRLRQAMRSVLDAEPLASTDYVSVAEPDSLLELAEAREGALASLAVRFGKTRLIDNVILCKEMEAATS